MIYPYEGCCSHPGGIDRVCRLAEYEADESYSCPECGRSLRRIITAPACLTGTREFQSFKSTVDGTIISCERELREHNKRNGVMNLHDGYDEKALMNMTKQDHRAPLDKERSADLSKDMLEAVSKLEQGYKPQPASQGDIVV